MKTKELTAKQQSKATASIISSLTKVNSSAILLKDYDFFDFATFKKTGFDLMLKNLCSKEGISEEHIRTVAGWKNSNENQVESDGH
jgi:hypothetical protein